MQAEAQQRYDVTVIGLGETGLACVRHLLARGRRVAVTDTRERPPRVDDLGALGARVTQSYGAIDPVLLLCSDLVVLSPGLDPRLPAIADAVSAGVPVIGEIELFAREARAPVVAITGSNGKSTVTTLVGEMAQAAGVHAAVGGNLGTPALELLAAGEPDLFVLELSSFQLETVSSLDAKAAVVLNISPDHLDRYASMADYEAAKRRIYAGSGVMVINHDDPAVRAMAEPGRRTLAFTLAAPVDGDTIGVRAVGGEPWVVRGADRILPVRDIRLAGRHNLANALAALALGEAGGLPRPAMIEALRRFPGLPHRMEALGERRGVAWFNDSKGTNVGATVAAVEGLDRPVVLIAGGQGKGQSFEPLARALRGRARAAVVIGQSADTLAEALTGVARVVAASTMEEAVCLAAKLAQAGDAVLLSPACASFDMFDGYAARGDAFRQAVEGLEHG